MGEQVSSAPRRVLVGWDGSDGARDAVRRAAALADGGHVVVVTVSAPRPYHAEPHDAPEPTVAEVAAAQEMEAQEAAGCSIDYRVVPGDRVPEALCSYAREHGFDLIIVGRHGEGGIRHARLGHVPQSLSRMGGISLLIAEPPDG